MLTPNTTYQIKDVTVNEKIIPDGTVWKSDAKAKAADFSGAGAAYKSGVKLSGGTGKPKYVTVHNSNDLDNVYDDAEQYTRATHNENMGSARVHFYVDDVGAWQNLKAGTGMCAADPEGSAEVSWHAGDTSTADGGNMTSLSIEVIMNETPETDAKARDNGARIAAWLLWKHGLTIDKLVTHTYWVNKSEGLAFDDVDEQCTHPVKGKKWCPTYIFGSYVQEIALKNWKAFKALVKKYLDALNGSATEEPSATAPYRVQTGAYTNRADAEKQVAKLKAAGFDAYIVTDDAPDIPWTPAVGDRVHYTGKVHYRGANTTTAYDCVGGEAEITEIYRLGMSKHPYHLKHTGKGCTVYGYVDAGTFDKA